MSNVSKAKNHILGKISCFSAMLLFAVIASTAQADTWVRLKSERQFLKAVQGKQISLIGANGKADTRVAIFIHSDGTWSGRGQLLKNIKGTWIWHGMFWCRAFEGESLAPNTNCQALFLKDDVLAIVRDNGTGDRVHYILLESSNSKGSS
jgi:hypothetical protein